MTALMLMLALVMEGVAIGVLALVIAFGLVRIASLAWPSTKQSLTVRVGVGYLLLGAGFAFTAFPAVLHSPANTPYFLIIWCSASLPFVPWWGRASRVVTVR